MLLSGVAHGGNNASGTAHLSWVQDSTVSELPAPPGARFPLFVLLEHAPDIRELAVTVRWSQTSSAGACYRLLPDSTTDESCGWADDRPPGGDFAGDTSYSWTIHFSPTSQKDCIKYWVSAEQCDSVPATFYLSAAAAMDSLGAVDSLAGSIHERQHVEPEAA
jgi:hypothetical protein